MTSVPISLAAFCAIFFGALTGVWAARRLPEPHLTNETRTVVSVSMAVVGTLAALVLSLMLTSASASFNARTHAIQKLAVDIIKLDRSLQRYGPDAVGVRRTLRRYAQAKTDELSAQAGSEVLGLDNLHLLETVSDEVLNLRPADERGQRVQAQALQVINDMEDARWLLVEQSSMSVPVPFLVLLIFWLSLLFASFGLFAPRNGTVVLALILCALAISGGILMILELGAPSRGLVRPSVAPMITAMGEIARE